MLYLYAGIMCHMYIIVLAQTIAIVGYGVDGKRNGGQLIISYMVIMCCVCDGTRQRIGCF